MSAALELPSETQFKESIKHDQSASTPDRPRRMPSYALIIEDDELHTYPYVIEVLQKVCGYDRQRAYRLTNQVHFRGQAAVWTGPLEHVELKRELIRGFGPDCYARTEVTVPLGTRIEQLP